MDLIDYSTIVKSVSVKQMPGDKLILYNEFNHKVSALDVQRVLAGSLQTITKQDIYEIRYSCSMAESTDSIIKSIHVNIIRKSCKSQVPVAQCR